MFLKNRNISSKMKRSKVTDYAALRLCLISVQKSIELLSRAKKLLILLGSKAKIVFDFSSEEYRTAVSSQETFDIVRISG